MHHINDKLLNFASILGDNTREQAETTSTLPFIYPHLALMPDAHLGKGATVGSVIPTDRAIIPAAVGVDIGCGMDAVRLGAHADELDPRLCRQIRDGIEAAIPLSPGKYNTTLDDHALNAIADLVGAWPGNPNRLEQYAANWRFQLGSLGGGNHFIEVVADEENRLWAFLHSGSRGVGNKIAQHHIKVAKQLMDRYWISLPDPDLAYLVEGTDEFWTYISELRWAQEFARLNRKVMMARVLDVLDDALGPLPQDEPISCHHNYTERERHFGRDLWVSRKGAISAKKGELGLIPGSMGAKSYVVEGLGFRPGLCSAPHGAGRAFSRSEARRRFTMDDFAAAMPAGVEYRHEEAFLDEIPYAYKDIDVVMQDAAHLVRPVHTLRQLVNVKGQ